MNMKQELDQEFYNEREEVIRVNDNYQGHCPCQQYIGLNNDSAISFNST